MRWVDVDASIEGPMRWLASVEAPLKSGLISEGQSLVAVPSVGMLVAFGGYNEKYYNSVHVLSPYFGSAKAPSPAPAPIPAALPVPSAAPNTEVRGMTITASTFFPWIRRDMAMVLNEAT